MKYRNAVAKWSVNSTSWMRPPRPASWLLNSRTAVPGAQFHNRGDERD
jgi:hypothetical protein